MGTTPKSILGIISIFFAVTFIPTIIGEPTNLAWWSISIFLLLIGVSCFSSRYRKFSLRIIGGTIFGTFFASLIASIGMDSFARTIIGFIIWGLPCLYLAIYGSYPS